MASRVLPADKDLVIIATFPDFDDTARAVRAALAGSRYKAVFIVGQSGKTPRWVDSAEQLFDEMIWWVLAALVEVISAATVGFLVPLAMGHTGQLRGTKARTALAVVLGSGLSAAMSTFFAGGHLHQRSSY